MNKVLFIKHGKNLDENNGGLYAYCANTNQSSISFPLTVNYQSKQYTYTKEQLETALILIHSQNKVILWQNERGFGEINLNKQEDLSNFINSFNYIFQEEQPCK